MFFILIFSVFSSLINCDFLLDQRLRDKLRPELPPDPFINSFYDKSYYLTGSLRPIYNVDANTVYGRVRGTSYQVRKDSDFPYYFYVSHFLGIPYAMPPTGENRFQLPREPEIRQVPTYDATYYRNTCFQDYQGEAIIRQHIPAFPQSNFSEDCLYLNIFAPNRTDRLDIKYPVMVFIHGGGFSGGSSQLYNGFVLAQRGVVVVTLNYRLGPLGFLSTESKSAPGNFGLHDQRLALKFVHENIEYFNGDRNNITLVGHEAGAASVGMHILSVASRRYFNKAIYMSGSDLCKWSYFPKEYHPLEFARSLARKLGCYDFDSFKMVQCLRQRSAQELMNANIWVPMELGGNPWRPVVDANDRDKFFTFLENSPDVLRNGGKFYNISVMFGVTSDEGAYQVADLKIPNIETGLTAHQFEEVLTNFVKVRTKEYYKWKDYQYSIQYADSNYYINRVDDFIDEDGIYRALQYRYTNWAQPENSTALRQKLIDLFSDSLYTSCVNEVARYHTAKWPNKTYMYVFEHRSTKTDLPLWMGSPHGNELYYLFGIPFFNESINIPWYGYQIGFKNFGLEDQEISNYTMHLFTNFIRWSDPTPYGYFSDKFYLNTYNPYSTYQTYSNTFEKANLVYTTSLDSFTKNLNVSWVPMRPNNMTYLVIRSRPELRSSYRFDEAGFWNYYWLRLWEKRLTMTPTPILRNAVFSYQDSYILLW
ncbi:neuroligin- X-linked-like, partial [Brachionus plicatilis]